MRSNLRVVEAEIDRKLALKNEAAAISIENEAKRLSPVDTGRLRSSITHDSDQTGAVIGTNVEYAGFVELGTRHQTPQPYLRPGLTNSIPTLKRIYGE